MGSIPVGNGKVSKPIEGVYCGSFPTPCHPPSFSVQISWNLEHNIPKVTSSSRAMATNRESGTYALGNHVKTRCFDTRGVTICLLSFDVALLRSLPDRPSRHHFSFRWVSLFFNLPGL